MAKVIDFFVGEASDVGRRIELLQEFFSHGEERLGALRLAILGTIELRNDDPRWEGAAQDFNAFFKGRLQGFQPLPADSGGKILKRFVFRKLDSDRRVLAALLAIYVMYQLERNPNLKEERPILKEAFKIDHTLFNVSNFILTKSEQHLSPRTFGYDTNILLSTLHGTFGTRNNDSIADRLFAGVTTTRRISSYAMYRYSTRWGAVVKTFLTILSPEINNFESFTFTNIYGPGGDNTFKRTSRGAVLGFQNAIYFLAAGGLIVESGNEASSGPVNMGLKAFVVPHAAFAPDHRLLNGLMLSNSMTWYPVVCRFAMVHVGFSHVKHEITDKHVGIRFLKNEKELAADVRTTCSTFKPGYSEDEVLAYILEKTNNYPSVDLRQDDEATLHRAKGLLRALTIEENREPLE